MKKIGTYILLTIIFLTTFPTIIKADGGYETEVYLLTCSPGSETYSMYGHSAIRMRDTVSGVDMVYNWGVFDFSTPNFSYKFARGRLDYMLGVYSYKSFLGEYFNDERSVVSQRINLSNEQVNYLKVLLNENMKKENRYYRYDFFMDNCATRIRDLLEKVVGNDLIYPQVETDRSVTYRERVDEYQGGDFIWLDMGIDLLLGSPADQPCGFRESMFLPDYLMSNLSSAMIIDESGTTPLLQAPVSIFEFQRPDMHTGLAGKPWFILSIVGLLLLFGTFRIRTAWIHNIFDAILFTALFFLSFLMIFTNYLTDHVAMGENFNMVWLNPLLLLTPLLIFMKSPRLIFWRIQVFLMIGFLILSIFIRQAINPAFIPVILVILARSWYRLELSRTE